MGNVLIVDDDFDIVDCASVALRDEGHHVHTAHTGEEGLTVLRSAPHPDVILLDVDMPVLGGPGMAHKMLLHDAGEEKIAIVLFSARHDLRAIAAEMGTPYALAKPCNVGALLAVIERAIREPAIRHLLGDAAERRVRGHEDQVRPGGPLRHARGGHARRAHARGADQRSGRGRGPRCAGAGDRALGAG